jgi:hypothetical protein
VLSARDATRVLQRSVGDKVLAIKNLWKCRTKKLCEEAIWEGSPSTLYDLCFQLATPAHLASESQIGK